MLEPRRNAVRPFGSDLIGMIGDDRARIIRHGPSLGREVVVNHQIEDSRRRDLSVVNLDLVGLRTSQHRH